MPAYESFEPGAYKKKRDKMMADGTWGKKGGEMKDATTKVDVSDDKKTMTIIMGATKVVASAFATAAMVFEML